MRNYLKTLFVGCFIVLAISFIFMPLPENQTVGGGSGTITKLPGSGGTSTFLGLTDTPSSYASQALKVLQVNAGETGLQFVTLSGGGDALTSNPLSQFAATTSLQLKNTISDETGSGALVFATSPTLTTPTIAKIANLTSNGFVKTSGGDGTLSIDTNTYLTGNQSITLSGDISGSGATSITTTIGSDKVLESMLKAVDSPTDEECLTYEATGGDFEWQTCGSGGGGGITVGTTTITSGTSGRIAFNNAGVYGEDSAFNWDNTSKSLKIGTGTPTYTVGTNNPLTMTGNMNTYYAAQLQNLSAGTTASTDLVLNADNATDTTNYLDIGIASSGNTDPLYTFAGAGEAYIYTASSNLAIATATSAKAINFFTGGTLAANLRLKIDGTGLITHTGSATTQTQYTQTYDTITTGKGQLMTLNGLTSGTGLELTSTSTGAPTTATYSGSHKGIGINLTGTNSTSSAVTYGLYVLNAKLGTTSQNYAIHADTTNASGLITNIPFMWTAYDGGGAKVGSRSSTEAAMWFKSVTPSTTNYTIAFDTTTAYFNSSFKVRSGASNQAGMTTGGVWFDSGGGNVATGGQRLISRNAATATANYGSISLGNQGNWAGGGTTPFAGSANGTHIAINEASGFAGSFADFQSAGASKFSVSATGLITTTGGVKQRVISMADATSITPTGDTADINITTNTQTAGTFTVNAPSGTPVDGQILRIRIKSTNVQTYSWNAIYRGGTLALPTASTGSSKTDYMMFIYNSADSKWDIQQSNTNY